VHDTLRTCLDDSSLLHLAADLMPYHQPTISVGQGTEYFGFDKYCKVQGIVRERSATYVPEQNGRAERLNRTLLERTRALMHEHKAAKVLWAHAIQAACMLKNCIPGNGQIGKPHQLLFGNGQTETKDRLGFKSFKSRRIGCQ
jgi:hypothetical protein